MIPVVRGAPAGAVTPENETDALDGDDGGAALLLYVARALLTQLANRSVTRELRDLTRGERARKVMLPTLPSGRTIPVNYLREADVVYAESDGRWWRERRGGGAPVLLEIRGEALTGYAHAIEHDSARTRDVFARLRPFPRGYPTG